MTSVVGVFPGAQRLLIDSTVYFSQFREKYPVGTSIHEHLDIQAVEQILASRYE